MSTTVRHILLGAASGILVGLALSGRGQRADGQAAVRAMSTSVLDETTTSGIHATTRPYFAGGLAALSAGAAAIHFAVTFEHFNEYLWSGVFCLVIAWAQIIWATVAMWRLPRWWLWLGIAGNAAVLAVYLASRTTGLPFGPDKGHTEPLGGLDVVSALLELALIAGCATLLWRPSLADRPVRRRTGFAAIASMAAIPAVVIAATTAVMTPGWAGPEGPAGMSQGMTSAAAAPGAQPGMCDMGTTDGLPGMRKYGSAAPATPAQAIAAGELIKQTGPSQAGFRPETAGHRSLT
jgi:hypothetical protein